MSVVNSIPLIAAGDDGYKISRSVRLRSSASAMFTRTVGAAATSNQKLTYSGWVKRGRLTGNLGSIFNAGADASCDIIRFTATDTLQVWFNAAASVAVATSAVFRDPSAWYHIVVAIDTTQATAANRIIVYVNGVLQTLSGTQPAQNATFAQFNQNGVINRIGYYLSTFFDGYVTEVNVIDGQALTPSSFGETNAITGVWQPKKYAGTYGTNGFYLNFSDNSTAAALGTDFSGNGNNWTPSAGISVTAGATYDSMLDVPTPYADGGNGRGNYCTLNPIANPNGPITTYSAANLQFSNAASVGNALKMSTQGTMGVSTGKWYYEFTVGTNSNTYPGFSTSIVNGSPRGSAYFAYTNSGGTSVSAGISVTGTPASITTNDVVGIAFDVDAGTATLYKNGVSQATLSSIPAGTWFPYTEVNSSASASDGIVNFGQRPFAFSPPTGFKALNTLNLPTPTISNGASYMAATIYTGTGSALTIANTVGSASFQPDLVWVKGRSGATDHALYDTVRGVQLQLESNTTTDETTETTGLTAFGSTGFTVGALAQMNTSAATYVAWQWKEGATQGFDIVTYTGNGSARTISHNLGVVPNMIIVKARTTASTDQGWPVYHSANTAAPETDYLLLNSTAATADLDTVWNDTAPTSSVFSVGTNANVNANNDTYVAYCFAAVAGYSAFGSYTGNGSADGPFVYTGFRPRFIMFKKSSATEDWVIFDTARNTSNLTNLQLYPNMSSAQATGVTGVIDILSNGFKIRGTSDAVNGSGGTYIFMAVAENPFKLSLAR